MRGQSSRRSAAARNAAREGRTGRARARLRTVLLATCLAAVGLGVGSSSAAAYEQWYCGGFLSAGYQCQSRGLHSLYYNGGFAVGAYKVGEYMWNAHNGVVRGGHYGYGPNGIVERVWNRTNDQWYNARVFNYEPSASYYVDGYTKA